jgi:hypothetical protein
MSTTAAPLAAALINRLAEAGVQVDVRDDDTAVFHGLPTDGCSFSKPRTNLLLARPGRGLPFLVAVDEDLDYTGGDPILQQTFAAARRQHGWRVLPPARTRQRRLQPALEEALAMLGASVGDEAGKSMGAAADPHIAGTGGAEPRIAGTGGAEAQIAGTGGADAWIGGADVADAWIARTPVRDGLLGGHGFDLTAAQAAGGGDTTVGRSDELQRLEAILSQRRAVLPVVVGPPGAGKTNLLHGLARRLADRSPRTPLVAVDLGELFAGHVFHAERESVLRELLAEVTASRDAREAAAPCLGVSSCPDGVTASRDARKAAVRPAPVLALEHLELVFLEAPHGPLLLAAALDRGARIVATALPGIPLLGAAPRLLDDELQEEMAVRPRRAEGGGQPLGGRLETLLLPELGPQATLAVLREACRHIGGHHLVAIDAAALELIVEHALALPGHLPGKAVTLLDRAAARAALLGDDKLNEIHVELAATS